jgi:hypothetical protein
MSPVAATLLLSVILPGAPAPKADPGLPADLINLLPDDTAAVLVIDVPRVVKTEFGSSFLRVLTADQGPNPKFSLADIARDAELILIAQFLIDKHAGDFCVLIRLKPGSTLPDMLLGEGAKRGAPAPSEKIGKRIVHDLEGRSFSFARISDQTLMMVGATGNEEQVTETRSAAYGERARPGPRADLRKLVTADPLSGRPVRVYGHHPTKLGHSAAMALILFGELEDLPGGDLIQSYRGGVTLGDAANIELTFTAKDADAAAAFLKAYDAVDTEELFVREMRQSAKATRDGAVVEVSGRVTRGMLERLGRNPNK